MRKKISNIVIFFMVFMGGCHGYKHFFSKSMITGTYENYNFNYNYPPAETPNRADKLIIRDDNTFENGYWGKGTYQLFYSFKGTEIDFSYKEVIPKDPSLGIMEDINMQVGYRSYLNRVNLGKTAIILCEDMNHYYKKVE